MSVLEVHLSLTRVVPAETASYCRCRCCISSSSSPSTCTAALAVVAAVTAVDSTFALSPLQLPLMLLFSRPGWDSEM